MPKWIVDEEESCPNCGADIEILANEKRSKSGDGVLRYLHAKRCRECNWKKEFVEGALESAPEKRTVKTKPSLVRAKRKLGPVLLVILVVLAAFLINKTLLTQSPSDVVKTVYKAAGKGNYSKVEKHLASDTLAAVNSLKVVGHALERMGVGPATTKDSLSISKVEILNQEVSGNEATVEFVLHYEKGVEGRSKAHLVEEGGKWKIALRRWSPDVSEQMEEELKEVTKTRKQIMKKVRSCTIKELMEGTCTIEEEGKED